jgi:hypothetical protein
MALPVLQIPTYELTLPSNSKKIKFRAFLVKEEKLLMIANETGEESERILAITQIIENCTFGKLDARVMPAFDVEYLFLKLRSKSIGESVNIKILCPDDKETYAEVTVNLDDITCKKPKKNSNIIKLDSTVGIILKYPGILTKSSDSTVDAVSELIESIYDGDTVFDAVDFSKEEISKFVESMTQKQIQLIADFFENIPKIGISIDVINPKTKIKSTVKLEGLDSFF